MTASRKTTFYEIDLCMYILFKIDKPVEKEKIMELLELEMRARAIKSLLTRTKGPSPEAEDPKIEESKKEPKK